MMSYEMSPDVLISDAREQNGSCIRGDRGMGNDMAKTRQSGRPPSGPRGQKVSDYPQVMIRLPRQTKSTLEALSAATGVPVWQLVDRAVAVYVKQLAPSEQKLVADVRARRARPDTES
jgi:hypothetical protein